MDESNRALVWDAYDPAGYYCEMLGPRAEPIAATKLIRDRIASMSLHQLQERAEAAERELFNLGITFTVYSARNVIDRILPFDLIPRVLSVGDWETIESGVKQRVRAINLFLGDIYHDQTGAFRVLEDNGRTPSGVSYVIENRYLMMRTFADLIGGLRIRRVDQYGPNLNTALTEIAPRGVGDPHIVLLSPGVFNAAYFEHVFLARELGVPLVEGRDLLVEGDRVFMKTTTGLERVDVIYRRIDDDFLDPEVFRPESLLGVPGLMRAYRAGNLSLANAVGTGVADDKAVYAYMPRIIRYYLGEDPIISNVETHICREPDGLQYTVDHLAELVVKPVGESGGYGITVGPRASKAELAACRKRLLAQPENFISQPMVGLSVSPTLVRGGIEPRHVDLRPFAITGADTWVLPGGLTRVALRKNSLIVNSSQGGGSKDTWVLA